MNQHYAYAQGFEAAAQDTAERPEATNPRTPLSVMIQSKKKMRWCHTHCPPGPLNEIVDDRKSSIKNTKRREQREADLRKAPALSKDTTTLLPSDSDLVHSEEIATTAFENDELALEMQSHVVIGAPDRRFGLATVKMYISVVVDLHNEQALADPHNYGPHPRSSLLQHYGLLRSENLHMIEFPGLQSMLLVNEDITPCYALVMALKQEKLTKRAIWNSLLVFGTKIPRQNSKKAMSYNYQLHSIKDVFNAVGLHGKAKTHAMRGSGSRMAEMLGTSEAAIRCLGHWNNSTLTNNRLTHLPREAFIMLAVLASEAEQFDLVRATIVPSEDFCKKVYSYVDSLVEDLAKGEVAELSTAVDGFLQLLTQLGIDEFYL
ncbi:hypothetical protein A0J61_08464 [Choanephora cucurbitarum]|uniref:Ndc10 domain-containing protein n=1 Tax=Choanephora cucurbitarum TaxID=101091 RepID=A0A1C7N820_9FUNG|nr:hypothetical protein A0J61_08464 [Choanephora cucurbitarum]